MKKKLVHEYTFDASAKTIVSSDFNRLRDIAIITNVTDGIVIYDALDATLKGTLSGKTLTLDYDTTTMADTDELQIIMHTGTDIDRIGFAKAISNGVDTNTFALRQTGSGMTVNQTGGNLVITTGTTARAETIIRSNASYSGGLRARIQNILSQRIANQQFFFEMVDVVGDGLAYTINSATSITVTLPASFGLSAQNVGQSMTLQQFVGTGTFLSGRYVIASVSGNNATFTVSGFAAGTGTLSAVGWNFYRLEYSGTTATNTLFDTGRNGYASGNTTATINTTASPGHMAIITANDGQASLLDQLIASTAAIQTANRATRVVMVPDDAQVYLQIRVVNGATAPASTTTWTIGQVSIGHFEADSVIIQDMRPTGYQTALPVEVTRTVTSGTQPVSGTVTATVAGATLALPTPVADVASAAITTTTTTAAFTPTAGVAYQPVVTVTAVTGTTPLLTVQVEESNDGGVNWFPRYHTPFVIGATQSATTTAVGQYNLPPLMGTGNRVRYVQTVTGTTPSITRSIGRNQLQSEIGTGMPYSLVSAATTNAALIKVGPTFITSLAGGNINASVRYLKLYDKATAPTVGTDPVAHTYLLPGATTGGGSNIALNKPLYFSRGLGVALTTGVLASDTGAVAANEITVNATIS